MAYKPCIYLQTHGRRVMKDYAFQCAAPDPVLPPMPASITGAYGFSPKFSRRYVRKEDCAACPIYTPTAQEET